MRLNRNDYRFFLIIAAILLSVGRWTPLIAQQTTAPAKTLTVDRIFNQATLSGSLTRGIAWAADGKQLCFFENRGEGKNAMTELWVMDAITGKKKLLISADKLETVLPAEPGKQSQATGLGRH